MLLWPNLVIEYYERGIEAAVSPTSQLVLPSFLFTNFMPEYEIKMSLAILMDNSTVENQRQINPLHFYGRQLHEQLNQTKKEDQHSLFSLRMPQMDEMYTVFACNVYDEEKINTVKEMLNITDDLTLTLVSSND